MTVFGAYSAYYDLLYADKDYVGEATYVKDLLDRNGAGAVKKILDLGCGTARHDAGGIQFFTPPEFSQQLAFMSHGKGKIIEPHIHNHNPRKVVYTQEVLVLRKGKLRVDFYSDEKEYLESRILEAGDIILLASGGHGFEVVEDIEMIEVKQGPFCGEGDKTRFECRKKPQKGIL